jgi:thiol-disulfide isomerase/thioredoxin
MKVVNVLFLLLTLTVFTSCEDHDEEDFVSNNVEISGVIKGAEGKSLFLVITNPEGKQKEISKAVVDGKGNFLLNGHIDYFDAYQLILDNDKKVLELIAAPNDKIKINTSLDKFDISPEISGVAWANQANLYTKLKYDFLSKQNRFQNENPKANKEDWENFLAGLLNSLDSAVVELIEKNPTSDFNLILFSSLAPVQSMDEWNGDNLILMQQVVNHLKSKYPESPRVQMIEKQTSQIERIFQEEQLMKAGKLDAPDFTLKTPSGAEIKLSSLKGQFVLIDFWASWCVPCRMENPNLVRLYNQYKSKGFTVFSVSLDDNTNKWKEAIQKDGLIWPNHGSDLQRWNTPLTKLYAFKSIPYTVLLNKEGKIIARGLRGAALENKLKTLLKP